MWGDCEIKGVGKGDAQSSLGADLTQSLKCLSNEGAVLLWKLYTMLPAKTTGTGYALALYRMAIPKAVPAPRTAHQSSKEKEC